MQRIERYGVIALVFLLVTILAVAVWGQRKNQSLMSFLKRDKAPEVAKVDTTTPDGAAPTSGLGLSDPTHEVKPASPLPPSPGGAVDPALKLNPPLGPGGLAVTFEQGSALPQGQQPAAGVLGGDVVAGTPGAAPQAPVAPGESATATADGAARTYKVKTGDTLGSIAQRELGSTKRWKEIEALNAVKADRLSVGMLLKLPAGAANSAPQTLVKAENAGRAVPSAETSGSTAARTYNVRSGDSLSKIAAAQLGDASRYGEILALNPGLNPAKLAVGESLRLPADAKTRNTESKPKPRPAKETPELARADAPKKAKVQ